MRGRTKVEEKGRKRKGKREREERGGEETADGVLLDKETKIYISGEQQKEQYKPGERAMERRRKAKASEMRNMHEKEVVFFLSYIHPDKTRMHKSIKCTGLQKGENTVHTI